MGTETQLDSGELREAAAAAVTPDALTADLLAKHSAGEKLSSAEYGKLGAFKARLKAVFAGKADSTARPGNGQSAPGHSHTVGALAPAEAPADSLVPPPLDRSVCVRTTASILKRCDAITVRWVEGHARRAGADDRTVARFRESAALAPADRELIADLSPEILAEMGIDPHKYPLFVVAGILGLHGTNLWLAVDDLKRMQQERRVERVREQAGRPEGSSHIIPIRNATPAAMPQ